MNTGSSPSSVHLGTGRLGLGLVVPALLKAGYTVIGVDRNPGCGKPQHLVGDSYYRLREPGADRPQELRIARLLFLENWPGVVRAIADRKTAVVTTAVSPGGFSLTAAVLAAGINARLAAHIHMPLTIISCENVVDNATRLRALVESMLSTKARQSLGESVRFLDSVADRICSALRIEAGTLEVCVESPAAWTILSPDSSCGELALSEPVVVETDRARFALLEAKKHNIVIALHVALAIYAAHCGYASLALAAEDPGLCRKLSIVLGALVRAFRVRALVLLPAVVADWPEAREVALTEYGEEFIRRVRAGPDDEPARVLGAYRGTARVCGRAGHVRRDPAPKWQVPVVSSYDSSMPADSLAAFDRTLSKLVRPLFGSAGGADRVVCPDAASRLSCDGPEAETLGELVALCYSLRARGFWPGTSSDGSITVR